MKLSKISLVTLLTLSGAIAQEGGAITGEAKIFYGTTDAQDGDLFDKMSSYGDSGISIKYQKKVKDGVTLNAGISGVSTLGLENELVSATWVDHDGGVDDVVWIDTANIQIDAGKTSFIVGRQQLDTPFFKSETWNIAPNTFDAAVAVNQNIPDTTLVGAWVGRGNGVGGAVVRPSNIGGGMHAFTEANKPAYAFGLINKSIPNTTTQGWYYAIPTVATAYWIQADANIVNNITLGLQYAGAEAESEDDGSNAFGVKVGYESDMVTAYGAYSKRNDEGVIDISNIATGHGASQSSLYTEAWWNYGLVGSNDAASIAVGVTFNSDIANLGVQYTTVDTGDNENDMSEVTVTVEKDVGPINATLAFINTDADDDSIDGNTVQVYLTAPFSL